MSGQRPLPPPSDGRRPAARSAASQRRLRALVIDDSAFFRQSVSDMLTSSGRFDVVGRASDGVDAMALTRRTMPDVITLDLEMPRMNGFSFLRWVMTSQPVPVLVLSSHDSHASIFHALELGAADFMAKPSHRATPEVLSIKEELCEKLELIAVAGPNVLANRSRLLDTSSNARRTVTATPVVDPGRPPVKLVVIGASTGGPPAIQAILRVLPPMFPAPIIVVQHMPPIFTRHFAERLNCHCPFTVTEAAEADQIEPGKVLVVPGGFHLTLIGRNPARVSLQPKSEQDRYAPSVDITMRAAASLYGAGLVGVLLTGMGNDGVDGFKSIKAHGGHTIAESEESAAIFGMPNEAIKAGVVDTTLPFDAIGASLAARAVATL